LVLVTRAGRKVDPILILDAKRPAANVRVNAKALTPRQSHRIVVVPSFVARRYEIARLRVSPDDAMIVRRVSQLVSTSTSDDPSGLVTDPAWLPLVEASDNIRIRFNLCEQKLGRNQNPPHFPVDVDLADITPLGEQAEGWIDTGLIQPWGFESEVRIRFGGDYLVRLFVDIEQSQGLITAVGGLLAGESRTAGDTPAFWNWWGNH